MLRDHFKFLRDERKKQKQPLDDAIKKLFSLETQRLITNAEVLDLISMQDIRWLETHGILAAKHNQETPFGTCAADDFGTSKEVHRTQQFNMRLNNKDVYRFEKLLPQGVGIISQTPTLLTQEEIDSHPFKSIPTHAISISTFSPENGNQWTPPKLIPYGQLMTNPLTTSSQYAQGGFEGTVVSINSEGQPFGFRSQENAKRLQHTAQGLCMPEVSVEMYMQALKQAVLANADYWPSPGSDSKLYVRPTIFGIDGGSGVAPASTYLFMITVFPFANYFASQDFALDLVAIENTRRSTPGGVGHLKYSGNYARTMLLKDLAKKGNLTQYPDQIFHDVFYLGEYTIKTSDDGLRLSKEVLEEDAAGNLIFWKLNSDPNTVTFYTPCLSRDTILPGITRNSILQMAKTMGHQVIEAHIPFNDISQMHGGMVVGSAAGAVLINSMTYRNQTITFDQTDQYKQPFNKIYETLYNLRRGDTSQFNSCPDSPIHKWPTPIRNI